MTHTGRKTPEIIETVTETVGLVKHRRKLKKTGINMRVNKVKLDQAPGTYKDTRILYCHSHET